MGKEAGLRSEDYFRQMMNSKGIDYEFVDSWYDFLIKGKYKVEVKSCQISIKNTFKSHKGFRIGRFDFTGKEQRKNLWKENVWVCLIIRHRHEFLLYGFIKYQKIGKRYLTLHQARSLKIMGLDEWILETFR